MEKFNNKSPVLVVVSFTDDKKAGVGSSVFWSAVCDALTDPVSNNFDNPFTFVQHDQSYDIGIHVFPEYQGNDFVCKCVFTGRIGSMISIAEIKYFREPYVLLMNHFKNDVAKNVRIILEKTKELSLVLATQRSFIEHNEHAIKVIFPKKMETHEPTLA